MFVLIAAGIHAWLRSCPERRVNGEEESSAAAEPLPDYPGALRGPGN